MGAYKKNNENEHVQETPTRHTKDRVEGYPNEHTRNNITGGSKKIIYDKLNTLNGITRKDTNLIENKYNHHRNKLKKVSTHTHTHTHTHTRTSDIIDENSSQNEDTSNEFAYSADQFYIKNGMFKHGKFEISSNEMNYEINNSSYRNNSIKKKDSFIKSSLSYKHISKKLKDKDKNKKKEKEKSDQAVAIKQKKNSNTSFTSKISDYF
ncbi:hypothetical protein HEP_00522300, partial [Hepatocystis sp. ex Piliocolobus tephrosceles]